MLEKTKTDRTGARAAGECNMDCLAILDMAANSDKSRGGVIDAPPSSLGLQGDVQEQKAGMPEKFKFPSLLEVNIAASVTSSPETHATGNASAEPGGEAPGHLTGVDHTSFSNDRASIPMEDPACNSEGSPGIAAACQTPDREDCRESAIRVNNIVVKDSNESGDTIPPNVPRAIAMSVNDFGTLLGISQSTAYSWMARKYVGKADIMGKTFVWISEQHARFNEVIAAIQAMKKNLNHSVEFTCVCHRATPYSETSKKKEHKSRRKTC